MSLRGTSRGLTCTDYDYVGETAISYSSTLGRVRRKDCGSAEDIYKYVNKNHIKKPSLLTAKGDVLIFKVFTLLLQQRYCHLLTK